MFHFWWLDYSWWPQVIIINNADFTSGWCHMGINATHFTGHSSLCSKAYPTGQQQRNHQGYAVLAGNPPVKICTCHIFNINLQSNYQAVDPDRQNLGHSDKLSFLVIYKFWQNCALVWQVSDIILKTATLTKFINEFCYLLSASKIKSINQCMSFYLNLPFPSSLKSIFRV